MIIFAFSESGSSKANDGDCWRLRYTNLFNLFVAYVDENRFWSSAILHQLHETVITCWRVGDSEVCMCVGWSSTTVSCVQIDECTPEEAMIGIKW